MDTGAASKEACVLEHEISDEAIDRLSRYIERPGHGPRRHCAGRCREHSLLEFAEGDLLEITMIRCLSRNRRLIDLGLIPGEQITIRRKLYNDAIVVRVKGADIALSPEIASTSLRSRSDDVRVSSAIRASATILDLQTADRTPASGEANPKEEAPMVNNQCEFSCRA